MQEFYAQLFGWKFEAYGSAAMISTGQSIGIQGHLNALGHEPHNYITVYVQVEDLQASLDQAAKLGGKTLVPPTEVPGAGRFAWLADPEGTVVGLWKPAVRG
jgi:predicted enzyme related to lactoylglutathione lyase